MVKYIAYYRVSTEKQGHSGLGLKAQREYSNTYVKMFGGEIVKEYIEVESGDKFERKYLNKALRSCKMHGYTLLTARIDRLTRSLKFLVDLMHSGIKFVASDRPGATDFDFHIEGAFAQRQLQYIRNSVKQALKKKKDAGVRLGPSENNKKRSRLKAKQFNRIILGKLDNIGYSSIEDACTKLNSMGYRTRLGKFFTGNNLRQLIWRNRKASERVK